VGLNVHETGIKVADEDPVCPINVEPHLLRMALAGHAAVVLPISLATSSSGAIVVLSPRHVDFVMTLVAGSVGALRCELIREISSSIQSVICSTYGSLNQSQSI